MSTTVCHIKVNYQDSPVGITKVEQIGYVLLSDKRGTTQKSCQIQISKQEEFNALVYDSGMQEHTDSAHVPVNGFVPESACVYYIRVRVMCSDGEVTPFASSSFVTALVSKEEWKAAFVSAETKADKEKSAGTYLRKEIMLSGKIKRALAFTTAYGLYEFYINGSKVGQEVLAPGWTSYHHHLVYQTNDVTTLLGAGTNTLGAMVGAGWYKGLMGFAGLRNHYGEQTAFACQLMIEYEDGSKEVVITDSSWKGADGPVVFSEIYDGETYDARLEIEDWNKNGLSENGWRAVVCLPVNRETLCAQSGSLIKEMTKVSPEKIWKTKAQETVIDFGQNMTGWLHMRVSGEPGAVAKLLFFEVLDADGNVYLDNLREAKQTITYICKGGEDVWFRPHFTFQGFRYAKIECFPKEPSLADFTAFAVHSDMKEKGRFACSNELLNQLQHNIVWGMKGNFLDVPTDCPQRNERLGWTGDAQIFCRTASFLMDTYTFYRKWMKDVAADQTPEGGVPHVVPDIVTGKTNGDWLLGQGTHSAAAWADVAVICPWTLYLTYGDKMIIEEQYESMKAWIDFMKRNAVDGIWNYKLQFGDWVALDAKEGSYFGATPNELTCTAYYAYSTGLFAKMAAIIGRKEDAAAYGLLYEEIKAGYQRHFFTDTGHLTAQTQTAQIITLYFELAPKQYVETIVVDLLKLLEQEKGHLVTGFVGTPYFCHALSSNGRVKEAYELLLKDDFPSWLYQVKMGATTVWEHWDGLKPDGTMWSPDMNSFNHYAYGAVGEWMYRVIAGLSIDEERPGYRHSIIEPRIGGGLGWVEASYESVYGTVGVKWERNGDIIKLCLEIPANTSASVILWNAEEIRKQDGIEFEVFTEKSVGEVASGCYEILYRLGNKSF